MREDHGLRKHDVSESHGKAKDLVFSEPAIPKNVVEMIDNNIIIEKKVYRGNPDNDNRYVIPQYTDLEIQFPSVKCAVVTRLHKNFEQLFIPSQAIQGDCSVLM